MKAVVGLMVACLSAFAIGCGSDVGGTWCSASVDDEASCTGAVFAQFDQRDALVTGKICEGGFDQGCAAIGDGQVQDDTFTFDIPNQDGPHIGEMTLSGDDLSGKLQTCACEAQPCTCTQPLSLHRIN
jgi:hypothetical protein